MFFPDRIKGIKPSDKVLEIGPGGSPHPRADVFLEMIFKDELQEQMQRSSSPPLQTDKPLIYYDGNKFPFRDKEFDYVICSHVLEHVDNVEDFLGELQRVASRGYIEFPTIYYDYLYNMPTHVNFLLYKNNIICYMSKSETALDIFKPVQEFFYKTLCLRYTSMIKDFKLLFFQGFEWFDTVNSKKVCEVIDVTYGLDSIKLEPKSRGKKNLLKRIMEMVGF